MTWVKICGMTNLEDALVAVDAGADAVGFVFYEKSFRYVSVETAGEIIQKLPESMEKIGVFAGATVETVVKTLREAGLTMTQIYSSRSSRLTDESVIEIPSRVIAAVSLAVEEEDKLIGFRVSEKGRDQIAAVLLDSGSSKSPGGTGQTFDWTNIGAVTELLDRMSWKLIVAGGLTPGNVGQAIQAMKPWGVDVASGVEARPGKKDPDKVRAFVRAVRDADRKAS
jgi:phosphoribosylanthranilate isomerase